MSAFFYGLLAQYSSQNVIRNTPLFFGGISTVWPDTQISSTARSGQSITGKIPNLSAVCPEPQAVCPYYAVCPKPIAIYRIKEVIKTKEKDQQACQDCFNDNCLHKKSEDFLPNCPADPNSPAWAFMPDEFGSPVGPEDMDGFLTAEPWQDQIQ